MTSHLRATLLLLVFTVLLCCVLYPLALWAVGQTVFRGKAQGSLIDAQGNVTTDEGKAVGSRLIAQPFAGDEYFQPRPSATAGFPYNAAASGASNWAASNYLLRDRVARQLGPIVKYHSGPKKGQPVAPDVETWFAGQKGLAAEWAQQHPGVAAAWVNADDKPKAAVAAWAEKHPGAADAWRKDNPGEGEPRPADLAVAFFSDYAQTNPGQWPHLIDDPTWGVAGVLFDLWRQAHPQADLEEVPADLVMASGSGLDPHITLKSARYQLDRVAGKWAEITHRDGKEVKKEIDDLLQQKAEAPFGGLVGVPLVNVLEVNLALRAHFAAPATADR
jgi:K+-transporting ATPase ATPase C chain